ncbi:MAG: ZIP family metal transporter [Micropruina sp.]|nr:ZIP family metal transporter [Micropruina sp.]
MSTDATPEQKPYQDLTPEGRRLPRWFLGLAPLILSAIVLGLLSLAQAPGLARLGDVPPREEVAIESVRLSAGQIELVARNEGPDPVSIAQVNVSDYFAAFTQSRAVIDPLQATTIKVTYDWVEGDPYEIALITSAGGKILVAIAAAARSPEKEPSFFALMALLGVYVGVIPVILGMLWLPFVRRSSGAWVRGLLGFTVGLLAFLGFDATIEGWELASQTGAFGGPLVVLLGVMLAYLLLEGLDGWLKGHRRTAVGAENTTSPGRLALLIAAGIGMHNLGEGLAIGSAYAVGSLGLGAALIVGFAIHNTTEGLAILSPWAHEPPRLAPPRLLGLIAGAPAIIGCLLGATVYQPTLAGFLLGFGAGAVGQVAIKILPMLRDKAGRLLTPLTAAGMIAGIAVMYLTGLLVRA